MVINEMMNIRSMKDIEINPILETLPMLAQQHGIMAGYVDYNLDIPTDDNSGIYFVYGLDTEKVYSIMNKDVSIKDAYEEMISHGNFWETDVSVCRVNNFKSDFEFNDYVCVVIHQLELVEALFRLNNLEIPPLISSAEMSSLVKYYEEMKNTKDASRKEDLKNLCNKVVKDIYKRREQECKEHLLPDFKGLVSKSNQCVPLDYFAKNTVDIVFTSMEKGCFDYFEEEIKKNPEIKYWKSCVADKVKMQEGEFQLLGTYSNMRKVQTEKQFYKIAYPSKYSMNINNIINDYHYMEYDKVPFKKLQMMYEDLNYTYIPESQMWNWNSLCKSNDVVYAIDRGEIGSVGTGTLRVIYPTEKENMVKAILLRLTREQREYQYVTPEDKFLSSNEAKRLKYKDKPIEEIMKEKNRKKLGRGER